MIKNIASINSEFLIINYIFNNLNFSQEIYEILNEDDFFFDTTKKYFKEKKFFYKHINVNENIVFSNLKNLIEKSKKRKMLKVLFNIAFDLIYQEKINKKIFEKVNILLNFKNNILNNKKINYFELLKLYLSKENKSLFTGYKKFDTLLNGFQKGDLVIIAGRPSIGKTSFAINIIKNLILLKKKIIIFTLEMTTIQIFIRIISIIIDIKQNNFKNNEFNETDIKKISFLMKNISFDNLIIKDCSSLSSNDIENQLNYFKKINDEVELIIIDYIQLMKSELFLNNRVLEISEISRSLKLIAKHYNCVVIALSQLNRLVEYRLEKTPQLSDLRDSGSIEQDADLVIFLHKKKEDEIDALVSKNRNGALGSTSFKFKNEYTKFEQI